VNHPYDSSREATLQGLGLPSARPNYPLVRLGQESQHTRAGHANDDMPSEAQETACNPKAGNDTPHQFLHITMATRSLNHIKGMRPHKGTQANLAYKPT
jgi:hypothetical protein